MAEGHRFRFFFVHIEPTLSSIVLKRKANEINENERNKNRLKSNAQILWPADQTRKRHSTSWKCTQNRNPQNASNSTPQTPRETAGMAPKLVLAFVLSIKNRFSKLTCHTAMSPLFYYTSSPFYGMQIKQAITYDKVLHSGHSTS